MFHFTLLLPISLYTGTNINYIVCPPNQYAPFGVFFRLVSNFRCSMEAWLRARQWRCAAHRMCADGCVGCSLFIMQVATAATVLLSFLTRFLLFTPWCRLWNIPEIAWPTVEGVAAAVKEPFSPGKRKGNGAAKSHKDGKQN